MCGKLVVPKRSKRWKNKRIVCSSDSCKAASARVCDGEMKERKW